MTYQLELTPISQIWTGNHERNSPRFLLGGFKGSLRWWYETLIRGLQTFACDPVGESRCILQGFSKEQQRQIDQAAPGAERTEIIGTIIKRQICPACYLFGCTGWQSRLELQGLGDEDGEPVQDAESENREKEWTCLEKGKRYTIQVKERWPLPLEPAEIAMLRLLCDFISAHGSLCARNGRKPSETNSKNNDNYFRRSHINFGLCHLALEGVSEGVSGSEGKDINADGLQKFLSIFPEIAENPEWPDFRYLWYTNQMIDRETMNELVKRDPNNPKKYLVQAEPDYHMWLGGDQGVSKKLFSYHKNDLSTSGRQRSWGYSKRDENFKNRLSNDLSAKKIDIKWGEDFFRQQGLFNE